MRRLTLKRPAHVFFPPRPMCGYALSSMTGAIKKLIELSAQRVRGQTHPVRNRLVVSHGEGLGGCDLLIV